MTCTCSVKGLEEVENMDRRIYFAYLTKIFRDVGL